MTEETVSEDVEILFYCKKCQRVISNPVRKGQKYEYSCPECKEDRVTFGTKKAISDFYHIKEKDLEQMLNHKSQ